MSTTSPAPLVIEFDEDACIEFQSMDGVVEAMLLSENLQWRVANLGIWSRTMGWVNDGPDGEEHERCETALHMWEDRVRRLAADLRKNP